MVPVPVLNSPTVNFKGPVAVGSNIYAIGGFIGNEYSSSISVLDCKSHKWYEAPRMRIERKYATANVVDGRIYVSGGSQDHNDNNKMEVFDTNKQTWDLVVSPFSDRLRSSVYKIAMIEGEIYLCGYDGVAYKLKEAKWIEIRENPDFDLGWDSNCVVDNVVYFYLSRRIQWYDSVVRSWNELKGLKGLPKISSCSAVELVACGRKLVVLWDKNVPASGYKEKMYWCAEISLEKRNSEEIGGKVEWAGAVLSVPESYKFVSALAATV